MVVEGGLGSPGPGRGPGPREGPAWVGPAARRPAGVVVAAVLAVVPWASLPVNLALLHWVSAWSPPQCGAPLPGGEAFAATVTPLLFALGALGACATGVVLVVSGRRRGDEARRHGGWFVLSVALVGLVLATWSGLVLVSAVALSQACLF